MAASPWQADNPYASFGTSVADSPADARAAFIRRTYMHLTAAVYALAAIEWLILSSGVMDNLMPALMGNGTMLVLLLGFLGVSWLANRWANSQASVGMQYLGLSLYVVAQAVILAPMLYFAQDMTINTGVAGTLGVVPAAGIATLVLFAALTGVAWFSGADFSFLGGVLSIATIAAVLLIIASLIFGFNLGVFFSIAMIAVAAGYILYDTSNVMHHYQPSQHVAASLALFASVALLFWYVLRLFMALSSRD